jgi:hypothetical protein
MTLVPMSQAAMKERLPTAFAPVKEPRVRKNGRCYVCKGPRPLRAVTYHDPFCSTACCRGYYEVPDTTLVRGADSDEETVCQPRSGT